MISYTGSYLGTGLLSGYFEKHYNRTANTGKLYSLIPLKFLFANLNSVISALSAFIVSSYAFAFSSIFFALISGFFTDLPLLHLPF